MRNNQPISIKPAVLPSTDTDQTNSIGGPDFQYQPITLFATRTGRAIQAYLPVEPNLAPFH